MLRWVLWTVALGAGVAHAGPAPVVGGSDAPAGKWPDCAAVASGGRTTCTGTLIAPTVVITAEHCTRLTSVLIGATSLDRPEEGEQIEVVDRFDAPDADVAVLVLERPARAAPRALATGWAGLDVVDGAPVAIVGFGAVDQDATTFVPELQEATSTINAATCARPECIAGELDAGGGGGIDSCNGDSGGPLYLLAPYGEFLIGVTSRSYDDAPLPCGGGGIYARADRLVAWIENVTGERLARGPEPVAEPIRAAPGGGAETTVEPRDPLAAAHAFEIVEPPALGTARVNADGRVRVCVDEAAEDGARDHVRVRVRAAPDRALEIDVAIEVSGRATTGCDVEAFDGAPADGGGCCSGAPGGASGALALAGLVAVRLRSSRRRARGRTLRH